MKVGVISDPQEKLLHAFLEKIALARHETSTVHTSCDVILNLDPLKGFYRSELPQFETARASHPPKEYILCHAGSAGWVGGDIGFSVIPPITDSSVLEITRPLNTPIEDLEKAKHFFESLGFTVSEVPDGPGLVQARIIACLANEAFSALAEGVADASTIDTAMKLGLNYPRGPLEWAELIGLNSILAILEGLQLEYGEDRYRPHPLLKRLVAAGMSIAQFEAWKKPSPGG